MNKENAHLFLPIVQALIDGKQIQYQNGCHEEPCWDDFEEDEEIGFYCDIEEYRIKPEQPVETEYRFLKEGEIIQEGDEYCTWAGKWYPTTHLPNWKIGRKDSPCVATSSNVYRRKDERKQALQTTQDNE